MKSSNNTHPNQNNKAKATIKNLCLFIKNQLAIPFLLFVAFTMLMQNAVAQSQQLDEVVYLKNGSIIRGIIIEQVPNKTIKIKTADENLFVFKMDEIEKITKEPAKSKIVQQSNEPVKIEVKNNAPANSSSTKEMQIESNKPKYKGHYKFMLEGSYVFGTGKIKTDEEIYNQYSYNYVSVELNNDDGGYSLRSIHGYQASETFVIGAGIGVDIFKNMTLLPIYLDMRLDLTKGNTRPFINAAVGTSVPLNAIEGGTNFNIGFGVKTRSDWTFSLNYRLQKSAVAFKYNYETYVTTGTAQFIALTSSYYF